MSCGDWPVSWYLTLFSVLLLAFLLGLALACYAWRRALAILKGDFERLLQPPNT